MEFQISTCALFSSFGIRDPRPFGFDAAVEFPPHGTWSADAEGDVTGVTLNFTGMVFDYREGANWSLSRPVPDYLMHRGLIVSWDNSPRRGNRAYIWVNATPANYHDWLDALVRDSRAREGASEFIFINAWNEWAEGAHLEPDLKYGHAYLEATRRALRTDSPITTRPVEPEQSRRGRPLVSVIIRSHNHGRFIREAIASVVSQTYENIELVVIDDGSTDGVVAIIEKTLAEVRLPRVIFRTQPMLGAGLSINRGIMLSTGEYVAILNSDDIFAAQRIATLVERAEVGQDAFLFSGVSFDCGGENRTIEHDRPDPRVLWYSDALRLASATPTVGFALLASRLHVSTSNFLFSRSLFEKVGGFNNQLRLAHDWDYVLQATRYAEPQFVPDELLACRYHSQPADGGVADRQLVLAEGRTALVRYEELTRHGAVNQLAPNARNWPLFYNFFCSRVTPWFATEPLVKHLPPENGDRDASVNMRATRHLESARDEAAIQHLQKALSGEPPLAAPAFRKSHTQSSTTFSEAQPRLGQIDLPRIDVQ